MLLTKKEQKKICRAISAPYWRLKGEDTAFSDAFDAYVNALVKELEIPERIAVALVTTETVKKYQRKLILHDLFSKSTVDEVLKCTNTKN